MIRLQGGSDKWYCQALDRETEKGALIISKIGFIGGKIVVDMSSISPVETKVFAKKSRPWEASIWMLQCREVKSGPRPRR